jgi:diguanylate cyclase (GGDEF)-like protein/PAS domain S-box-containing protein
MGESTSGLMGIDCRAIFDASLDATFIVDFNGQIFDANRAAVQRYGYSLEELKQMNVSDLAAQGTGSKMPSKLGDLLKWGEIFEWSHRRKDGSELAVEINSHPITHNGQHAVLWNVRDISLRKNLVSELQNRKHLLERILDTGPGAVYIYDLVKQQNVFINRHWLTAFGYTVEEAQAMGVGITRIIHPDDLSGITANHAAWRDATDGETRSIEYRIRDKQGGWHWLVSRETQFTRDKGGQVSQILGAAYDITGRKRAEILLGGQNQVLEMMASGASLPVTLTALIRLIEDQSPGMLGSILLLDEDGVHVRHGAAPNLPAEFVAAVDGQPIGPFVGSCGTAAYRKEAVFVEDIATDSLWATYKAAAIPHGLRACWSTPIFDAHGRVLGTFAMYYRQPGLPKPEHLRLIDIATHIASIVLSRHRAEEMLRQSEARYRSLFEYAPDGIVIADSESYYLDANASACQMLGYSRSELIGLNASDIVAPTEIQHIAPALQTIKARIDYQREWQLRRKDGSVFAAEVMATTMPDGNVLGVIRDITERKAVEAKMQRLTQLYAALSQCNQAIVRCANETELLPQVCRDAVNFGGMKMAWIGMVDMVDMVDMATKLIKPVASFGTGIEYLDGLEFPLDANKPAGLGPAATSIRDNQPCWCQDFQHDPATALWHERGAKFGWGASASLPLHRKGVAIGTFGLYTGEANAFDEAAQNLLIEMAMDISFALDRFASEGERKQEQTQLRKLSQVVEQSPTVIIITDLDANIEYANTAFVKTTGYSLAEVIGKNPRLLQSGKTPNTIYTDMWSHLTRGESWHGELTNKRKDGSEYIESMYISPMRGVDGRATQYFGFKEDITERKRAEERVQYLANFDALTGLPNRTQLDDHLKYALSLAKRNNGYLAVMFLDLDRFKDINDTLGHSVGDVILVEVARRLKLALREEDTVSRLGGDEFILMLPGSDARGAAQVAQKLLRVISAPYRNGQYDLIVTASIGIALYPDDGMDMETLSKSADTAMYRAKQEGRDGYRFFTAEMQARATRSMQLVNALRHALERDQFHVHYQSQVSIGDGRIIGAEALLRWQHPMLGNVSPAEFIPVAEDCGLILPIGEWVLRTAVKQLKRWMDGGHPPMLIAVNLSAVQFRHPSLLDMVTRILNEEQLPPEYLELELTERVAMHDPQGAITVMNKLHDRGIRMSIDDFGTGYSSLNYLKKFKVYKLKIDQSFVRDICTDLEDRAIVAAIISMSKNLGLQTIAEGVETAEQLAFLREQGCDEAQGYYCSKPLPAAQFELFFVGAKMQSIKP